MQYLAELQKTQAAFGLGGNSSVRLLARNTGENVWQPITNEQVLPIQDSSQAKDFKDGQMIIAEVTGSNQVQSIQDASKKIVNILQAFSRSQDKYKSAEEEVEQWKQSLNFQSQELHRREQELEQKELELEHLEARKQEIEELESKFAKERNEIEQLRKNIEAERGQFEAKAASLTVDQAEHIKTLISQLSTSFTNPDSLRDRILSAMNLINQRQEVLTGFWQNLDGLKSEAEKQKGILNKSTEELNTRKTQWQQTQVALADAQAELKAQRGILKLQENNMAMSRVQLDAQIDLYEQTSNAIETFGGPGSMEVLSPEEESRLQSMPIEELESTIKALQADFDKLVNYVSAQEDELAGLEGEIADLQSQVETADQFARIELESNKEFAEEQYKLLEESVSGMRRSMQERLSVLNQQKAVLDRRKGIVVESSPVQSLLPLLAQIEAQKNRQEQELRKMESQIEAVRNYTQQQQEVLGKQNQEHQQQEQAIRTAESQQQDRIRVVAELLGQISAQEQLLRPVQDIVDTLRPQLEAAVQDLGVMSNGNNSSQILADLQSVIQSLVSS
ncbi:MULTISPECIES: pilus motility taxis protein HmpF [Pseudanabaena]|uniref:pilus motility taxis protein HmpF n=1 Tax=Pseudanabaena TaxID=1152 RepID=UPI0024797EB1|nr:MULTISPECIES: pilus motility taxis protein HmpF [Pseudanabaena]MEA5487231.1 pilus motility taxis protein HmpF [Pseudanabaena sp. CCNP1317]WGS70450.1 pilus motility taxis protein HmpF [Pseudanabaena galeata CCNP1313]